MTNVLRDITIFKCSKKRVFCNHQFETDRNMAIISNQNYLECKFLPRTNLAFYPMDMRYFTCVVEVNL